MGIGMQGQADGQGWEEGASVAGMVEVMGGMVWYGGGVGVGD